MKGHDEKKLGIARSVSSKNCVKEMTKHSRKRVKK